MSSTYSSKSRPGKIFVWLIIISIVVGGYSGIRYLIDRHNYAKGHQAYQKSECAIAIDRFNKVINGRRLFDIGGYLALSQKEKKECIPFQIAIDKQQSGEFNAALVAYVDFVSNYEYSVLANTAYSKVTSLFEQSESSTLASPETCDVIDILLEKNMIPRSDVNLPPFYFACGQVYDSANIPKKAFVMYQALLLEYPDHSLTYDAEELLLENPMTCDEIDVLHDNTSIVNRVDFMPTLYYNCGQAYDNSNEYTNSFNMYKSFLIEYPEHSLANEVESALLSNSTSCNRDTSLKKTIIAERANFIPTLYYNCGQAFEDDGKWGRAISMYEKFLDYYPNHTLASDVEDMLARVIVEQAKDESVGEILAPESSGSTGNSFTEVIIQNDSPESLRIVFSGPESHVEELPACSSCKTYEGIGPLYCPERGPIGSYQLEPGQYDIVVESTSDSGTTSWTGSWDLNSGKEYYNCFFITVVTWP